MNRPEKYRIVKGMEMAVSGKKRSQHDTWVSKRFDENLMNSFSGTKIRKCIWRRKEHGSGCIQL